MKCVISGFVIVLILIGCGGNNTGKVNEADSVVVEKAGEEVPSYALEGTNWSAEKRQTIENNLTYAYHAGIVFTSAKECYITEAAINIEENSETSSMTYEGVYECKGSEIFITAPDCWGEGKNMTWTLLFGDNIIIYNSNNYGEFILKKTE